MLKFFMKSLDVTFAAPLNVMTYDIDFSCGEWKNHHSFSPNESLTTNRTNMLESILKTFMKEAKLLFQAQRDNIKNLETDIG